MITISINPVAFAIGPISVRWYGIMVAVAVLVIILWLLREVRKGAKLSSDTVFMAALVGIPSGIVVSRLLHIIDEIENPPMRFSSKLRHYIKNKLRFYRRP